MSRNHLFAFGLLLLSMTVVGGCAQKMVKQDNAAPPPGAQPAQQGGDAQAKTAAPETAAAPQAAMAADAASTTSTAKIDNTSAPASPPSTPTATAKDTAAAAALLPLPPKEIVDTIKKLTTHPRVRYLSRTAQYDYYVGGSIDAKYDINKNEMVVTNSPAREAGAVTCEYSKDGKMISGDKSASSQTVSECNRLINELTGFLAQ